MKLTKLARKLQRILKTEIVYIFDKENQEISLEMRYAPYDDGFFSIATIDIYGYITSINFNNADRMPYTLTDMKAFKLLKKSRNWMLIFLKNPKITGT